MSGEGKTGRTNDEIYEEVAALKDLFARRLMDDKVKNAAIEKLSASNAALVKAVEESQVTGLVKELILLCDRIYSQPITDEFAYSVLDELLEIMSRRGIEQIRQLDTFAPRIHNAVSVVPARYCCSRPKVSQARRKKLFRSLSCSLYAFAKRRPMHPLPFPSYR